MKKLVRFKKSVSVFIHLFFISMTSIYSQDTSEFIANIELLRNHIGAMKGLSKTEDLHLVINKKTRKEFIQRWRLTDSLTNTLISADKLHSITSKKQRHDIWETYYYNNGKLEYATVLNELKLNDGTVTRKYGYYYFNAGKLVAKKEENKPEINGETLLKTSETFTF